MTQKHIIKLFAGASLLIRQVSQLINEKTQGYIDRKFLKGNYVTREEFERLRELVLKFENNIVPTKNPKKDKKLTKN